MLQDLSWENYLELTKYIEQQDFKDKYFSPVVLMSWRYYGTFFKYRILDDNCILFYARYGDEYTEHEQEEKQFWYASSCLYTDNFDLNKIKKQIILDCEQLNEHNNKLMFTQIPLHMIVDFKLDHLEYHIHGYISNYVYDLSKMRTFAGRKLQKKRNHLNAFYYQHHKIKIESIHSVSPQDVLLFAEYHIKKYAENFREYEMDMYKQYLLKEATRDENYKGIVIYINDKIVAFTLCYIRNQVCDVLIEKAEHDIRGLYQYLIKTNLEYNDINVLYMDREDDAGVPELAHSKKSYYPILMLQRYRIDEVKGWQNEN